MASLPPCRGLGWPTNLAKMGDATGCDGGIEGNGKDREMEALVIAGESHPNSYGAAASMWPC